MRILSAALVAVDPSAAVHQHLRRSGNILECSVCSFNLASLENVYIVGAGKAGAPMAQAVSGLIGDHLTAGIIAVKEGYDKRPSSEGIPRLEIFPAGHPLPDERSLQATRRICNLLSQTTRNDLVICLISGGGSALLTKPAAGITLDDLRALTEALLACGANINEINTLRKHLDLVKGGQLARLAAPAQVLTLILSDVVGNPLDVIASGPTVPDPSTYSDALSILKKYQLLEIIPESISSHLIDGAQEKHPETPKPGDQIFDRVQNAIIGSNALAAAAAFDAAQSEGYHGLLLTTYLQGEARQAGRILAAIARQVDSDGQPVARPACLIAGGETTVTLRGDGLGGRNQELALGAVEELAKIPELALVSLATDGSDGPTDAAGAVVTGSTVARARRLGLDPADYLARNDSYHFFEALGDLIFTGPTQTNVNDLVFLFLH